MWTLSLLCSLTGPAREVAGPGVVSGVRMLCYCVSRAASSDQIGVHIRSLLTSLPWLLEASSTFNSSQGLFLLLPSGPWMLIRAALGPFLSKESVVCLVLELPCPALALMLPSQGLPFLSCWLL